MILKYRRDVVLVSIKKKRKKKRTLDAHDLQDCNFKHFKNFFHPIT